MKALRIRNAGTTLPPMFWCRHGDFFIDHSYGELPITRKVLESRGDRYETTFYGVTYLAQTFDAYGNVTGDYTNPDSPQFRECAEKARADHMFYGAWTDAHFSDSVVLRSSYARGCKLFRFVTPGSPIALISSIIAHFWVPVLEKAKTKRLNAFH